MNKKLYNFLETLGALQVGQVAETVNLGEDNYKLWFNPESLELEYKDYPDQVVKIIAAGHSEYPRVTDSEEVLFRIVG